MTIEAGPAAADDPGRQVLPFIVAITGKRNLKGKEEAVRSALHSLFETIDAACGKGLDKILLTGAASGADTIAAEVVRGRPRWSTIAVLPLEETLFRQDFPEPSDLKRFDALLAGAQGRIVLKPLLAAPGGAPLELDGVGSPA